MFLLPHCRRCWVKNRWKLERFGQKICMAKQGKDYVSYAVSCVRCRRSVGEILSSMARFSGETHPLRDGFHLPRCRCCWVKHPFDCLDSSLHKHFTKYTDSTQDFRLTPAIKLKIPTVFDILVEIPATCGYVAPPCAQLYKVKNM